VLNPAGKWLAAVLACGTDAVLSHHSAAALWGIRDHTRAIIDVTTKGRGRSEGQICRHHAKLQSDEVTTHEAIPVTTVPRTIFDLAAVAPQAVEPALRQAEYLRLYDPLSLGDLLRRYPGHRGNLAVRAALDRLHETPGRTRSAFEDRFLAFLDHHGLPRPHFNAWLSLGSDRFQVDCLWPDRRLIVELDGWSAHGTRAAFRSDKARDRKLAVAGYTTTRIPWSALEDEPAAIASDLRQLLGRSPAEHT
jgi:very-short-patch-repair endonuclease